MMRRIADILISTLINKIFTLEEGPEMQNLPNPKANERRKSEPGKLLHSVVR
jgi:hypothetical protein